MAVTVVGIWLALGTPPALLAFLLTMERIESRFLQDDPEPVRTTAAHRRVVHRNRVKKSTASSPSSVHG